MMTQQTPPATPKRSFVATALFAVVALVAGSFFGQYMERTRASTPQSKLDEAVQQFQAGYDDAAMKTLKPLADQGNAKAQYWLADIYENGLGVKKDLPAAIGLLIKSATQGFEPAERRLGSLYLQGDQTFQDFAKAQTWLRQAAATGDSQAEQQLGQIYAMGLGVSRNLPEAYGWYENAAIHGDGLAQHLRDTLVPQMSPADQAQGEQAAKKISADDTPPASPLQR